MPRFYEDVDIDIEVSEFLDRCDSSDIKELIKALREDGHLDGEKEVGNPTSAMEIFFERSLDKLHGSYHLLGTEDIEAIERIAKRF